MKEITFRQHEQDRNRDEAMDNTLSVFGDYTSNFHIIMRKVKRTKCHTGYQDRAKKHSRPVAFRSVSL